MIEAALSQLRYVLSVGFGTRFSLRSLERLVKAMRETREEFGDLGPDHTELLGGPVLDPATRREMQLARFRKQALLAARETNYYYRLFQNIGLNPSKLTYENIATLPLTSKEAVRKEPDAFVNRSARPFLRALTTGTTGKPTAICFSEYEMQVYFALSAISYLSSGEITTEDIVQINTSSRGMLGNLTLAGGCAQVGAQVYLAGVIESAQALAMLTEERHLPGKRNRTSVLYTYPSYLGELVTTGLELGYQPSDFGLRNIIVGGELVSTGLKNRAAHLFGQVNFLEGYGITELWPLGAQRCEEGHLHFEPSQGLVEVINPDTGLAALPGEVGVIVGTPFPPYRETTLLLRYNTGDVVRVLETPPKCSLANLPATSQLLGKLNLSVHCDNGWVYPRQICEGLEELEEIALPTRFGFWVVPGGVAVEVASGNTNLLVRSKIEQSLLRQAIPLRELYLVERPEQLRQPYPWRGDLREYSFNHAQVLGLVVAECPTYQ